MGIDSNNGEDDAYETEVEVGITEIDIWCDKHLCTHETAMMVIVGGRRICAEVSCVSDSIFREFDEIINPNPGFVIRNVGDQLNSVKGPALMDGELQEDFIFRKQFAVLDEGFMSYCIFHGADFISCSSLNIDYCVGKLCFPNNIEVPLRQVSQRGNHRVFPIEIWDAGFPPGVYEIFIGCRTHCLRY